MVHAIYIYLVNIYLFILFLPITELDLTFGHFIEQEYS